MLEEEIVEEIEYRFRQVFPDSEREKICQLGQKTLFDNDGKEALDYLVNIRQFSDEVIKKMELGYMPKHIQNCLGNRHELSGRIIIPIRNQHGELIALSSRDWRKDAFMPFWHESFSKGTNLYGIHLAKKSIISNKKVILVEGQFDVGKLWQVGINFVVGVLGSAPQFHQISILSRYCKEVFAVFDGDTAGKSASDRLRDIVKENGISAFGINIIYVHLPNELDPDDFIKKFGRQDFINLLKKAKEDFYNKKEK
jgi:DNA primase